MLHTSLKFIVIVFFFTLNFSCSKPTDEPTIPGIDSSLVRITDFQLEEVAYSTISITHPVVVNGIQTQPGEIRLTIPGGTGLQLTPKVSNFNIPEFTVSPQPGQVQDFSGRTIIYTVSSTKVASKFVQYAVTITEVQSPPVKTALNSFKFEKAKNPFLPADIEASRILEGIGTIGKIFVFVPAGTSFSSLTPTIGYEGTGLFYSQDPGSSPNNVTTVYPAAGLSIDFKYPKVFYAIVKNASEIKTYQVFVDVKLPIRFDILEIVTADVKVGQIHSLQATSFINAGNHPINLVAVDQSNHIPAGANAVRGMGFIPSGGLKPGERANVTATISAQTWPAGEYGVTSTFRPKLHDHPEANDLLEATSLKIKSRIVQ